MVLPYVRPHKNLSTCASGCQLLLASAFSGSQSLFFNFPLVYLDKMYESTGEIKDFVVVVVVVMHAGSKPKTCEKAPPT